MTEWLASTLGDLIKIKHGFAFSGSNITTEETDKILLTPGNFKIGGGFNDSKFKYFRGKAAQEYILNAKDLVVTMTDLSKDGDTLGYSAIIPRLDKIILHNQRIGLVETVSEKVDKSYVNWLLRTSSYREHILGTATGTSVQHTSPSRILGFKFELPPLPEQKAIAAVLSSLDGKIDLLHRQNATLEAMAEALFRQWFVVEAKDEWEERPLLQYVKLVGGGTPKTSIKEYWGGSIPWLSGGDIAGSNKSFVLYSEKTISEEGLNNSSAKLLPKFATVLTARGTVGKFCLLGTPMACSQTNYGILPADGKCYFFTFLLVDHLTKELQMAAYGSVFDTITTQTFEEVKLALPNTDDILEFEGQVTSLFSKMFANQNQIRTLEKLRDTLLPKLMSGEVRVES